MSREPISLDPKPDKLIFALRQIGYSFSQAIADLIDNSINAKAKVVAVQAVLGKKSVSAVVIADDGKGMARPELDEAMRLGADTRRDVDSLGKYGMGLKLSSLSQAQRMTVVTRSGPFTGGRRWTIAGISEGWRCEVLEDEEVAATLSANYADIDLKKSGTVVIWEELDKIRASKNGPVATANLLFGQLRAHLGLHFHRFIEDKKLTIRLQPGAAARYESLEALNPFSYDDGSGSSDYPLKFRLDLGEGNHVLLDAHIWPPHSRSPNYKLGGKAASRQGFYFYRNDRLLQAGGWNELRGSESEPHLSLARVRIDLPRALDEQFGVSVQKASIQVPPSFVMGVNEAATADGNTRFHDFIKTATQVYRTGERRNVDNFPVIPSGGFGRRAKVELQQILAGRQGRVRRVDFHWERLTARQVFELDRERNCVLLNSTYRSRILMGSRSSSADAPIVKALLFMLVRDYVFTERNSTRQKAALDELNAVLLTVVETIRDSD